MTYKITPYLQMLFSMILVGSSVVAGKMLTATLPVMMSSCLRFAIATPILFSMLYFSEGRPRLPSPKILSILFAQAFFGVFLFSIFLLTGLKHTGAIEAGLISGTLPAVTVILSLIFLRDKLNRNQIIGIICTVIGAIILNGKLETTQELSSSLLGMILVFGAIVCEASFVVFGKCIPETISPLKISTTVCFFGFILFLPFAIMDAWNFDFSQTTIQDWLLVLYFGIGVTVLSFWLFYTGLPKVSAATTGAFMAFIPLSAIFFSSILLGETLHSMHLMGGTWIIFGILLACVTTKSGLEKVD